MKKFFMLALVVSGCTGENNGATHPPTIFYAKPISTGAIEMTVQALPPFTWTCKGLMVGRGDVFNLAPQTVNLACVGGPVNGTLTFVPNPETRFAEMTYKLNSGFEGKGTLR